MYVLGAARKHFVIADFSVISVFGVNVFGFSFSRRVFITAFNVATIYDIFGLMSAYSMFSAAPNIKFCVHSVYGMFYLWLVVRFFVITFRSNLCMAS